MLDQHATRKLIEIKRSGSALPPDAWRGVVKAFMSGGMDEAQMAALCMAVVWRGMEFEEIVALTQAMVESGSTIDFGSAKTVIDKHSSGGVSDLVSLVGVPLAAACGVAVAKLSGRALGHTGGTIDKLESIAGFRVNLSIEEFRRQVESVGCAIAAQTADIVPADKRLYALRDRTGTVPSKGLICASIVSKKVAGGADAFVFDVKVGAGAFMHRAEDAVDLASTLVRVSQQFGKRASAAVTNMDEPLGTCIGTGLEVAEAVRFLRGEHQDERAKRVCMTICSEMLRNANMNDAEAALTRVLESGAAYEKFVEMVRAQGGSRADLEAMAAPRVSQNAIAKHGGHVRAVDVVALGNLARLLAAGDSMSGIRVHKRIGDPVEAGEVVAEVYGGDDSAVAEITRAFEIDKQSVQAEPLVYEVIGAARPR